MPGIAVFPRTSLLHAPFYIRTRKDKSYKSWLQDECSHFSLFGISINSSFTLDLLNDFYVKYMQRNLHLPTVPVYFWIKIKLGFIFYNFNSLLTIHKAESWMRLTKNCFPLIWNITIWNISIFLKIFYLLFWWL